MGMTIAEKILARASGKGKVEPGQFVIAKIDRMMVLAERLGELTGDGIPSRWPDDVKLEQVWDPEKVIVVIDHMAPPANVATAQKYAKAREGARKLGIEAFYDIGRGGICHQLFCQEGYARPGDLIVGTDSHTCTYGAFNTAARGINYEAPFILATGETWFKVPSSIKFNLSGKLPKGVYAKDIVLHIAGKYGTDIAINKAIEYSGPLATRLSLASRMTMSNMGVELGAKFAIFDYDDKTQTYLEQCTNTQYNPVKADEDAQYAEVYNLDVSSLEPQVACPHDVGNVKTISEIKGTKIDQAFIGSCTNGRYEDLEIAARILQGHKIHPDTRLIITPASEKILNKVVDNGLAKIFSDAEAIVTNSTCGACAGIHLGVLGPEEVCIGSQNRNFKGRMGDPTSEVYLGSPATVAASAIKGVIADPREYL